MTTVVRIETDRGGPLESVPFVWTSGPRGDGDGGRERNSLAKVVPANVRLIMGTRNATPNGDGTWQETFTGLTTTDTQDFMTDIERLGQMFRLAREMKTHGSQEDAVWMVERIEGEEYERRAIITGGIIVPLDDGILDRGNSSGMVTFAITITRMDPWEFGDHINTGTTGVLIGAQGGHYLLPSDFSSQGYTSRMTNVVFRSAGGGYFRRFWLGIKPNRTGFTSRAISPSNSWDPKVWVGEPGKQASLSQDTSRLDDVSSVDGNKLVTNFTWNTGWQNRFALPISRWNYPLTLNDTNRMHAVGEYHLLARYKVTGDDDSVIGVRFGTGWERGTSVTWNTDHYLRPIRGAGASQWHYEDFGKINVASNVWGKEVSDRLVLDGFRIWMGASLAGGTAGRTTIQFDDAVLVPANHFIYVDAGYEVDSNERVEVYVSPTGVVNAFAVNSSSNDYAGNPLVGKRRITANIADVSDEGWGVPWEPQSMLVCVADRETSEKAVGSNMRIDIAMKRRTENFARVNTGA